MLVCASPFMLTALSRVSSFPHIQKETCHSSKALSLFVSCHAGQGKLTHVKQFPSWKSFHLVAATEQGSFQVILWSLNYLRTLCPQSLTLCNVFPSQIMSHCLLLTSWTVPGRTRSPDTINFPSLSWFYDFLRCSLSWPPKIEMFIKSSREVLFIL